MALAEYSAAYYVGQIKSSGHGVLSLCINDTHRENCVLLNSVQEFIDTEAEWFDEWLLLSAFQQGIRQNLSWFYVNTGKRFFLEVSF